MDSAAQAAGEKRVRDLLIDPLAGLGLVKPSGMKVDQFTEMKAMICAKLAYMADDSLAALAEQVSQNGGGKMGDQFPKPVTLLKWAAQIEAPGDDASPLVRAVFKAQIGRDALAAGWAPELLADIKHTRRWPIDYGVKLIKDKAVDSVKRLRDLDDRLARGLDLSANDAQWRAHRIAALQKCQDIADLAAAKEVAQ